jgi:hypothetical protein
MLVDLRIGVSVAELRSLRLEASEEERAVITPVLEQTGLYYRRLRIDAPEPPPAALLFAIDHALWRLACCAPPERRRDGVLALTSLRRNLFPGAPVWVAETEVGQ